MREGLYRERAERFGKEAEAWAARSRLVSNLRGLAFVVMIAAGATAIFGSAPAIAGGIALAAAVAFAVLVIWHARVIDAEAVATRYARVNHNALARVTGRWRTLPEDGAELKPSGHPYAEDLDVLGHASLFQRINVAHTRYGQERLAELLLTPSSAEEASTRRGSVESLAAELELRQRFEALSLGIAPEPKPGRDRRVRPPDPEPLLLWAESEPELEKRPLIVAAAFVVPLITIAGLIAAWHFGKIYWFTLPFLIAVALISATRNVTARVFTAVSSTEGAFLRYGGLLEVLEKMPLETQLFSSLRDRLLGGPSRPSAAMQEFSGKVGWFDLRHNGLIHPVINVLLLWDIHCVLGLERWQRRHGKAARGWFKAIGEFEALSSLAGLAHDEPDFSFPELTESTEFTGVGIGHPLIDSGQRVANDIALPQAGTALLVTGSNMSGKSTLLRAMGLAAVMAYAGGPVCATRLRLGRFQVCTSVRVSDSLEQGVSHFYAEINKLKSVVDASHRKGAAFFLLDEILHGTNSRERQIGARWIMSELIRHGAIGAVSTHDMGLCELSPELMARVTLVHFRENVEDGKMTFDYKLRPGPVSAGNALRLMNLIGLEVPLE